MDRWQNKVAVVTGASSGIGAAIVKDLVKAKVIVVGLARRIEKIEEIRYALPKELQSNLHSLKCDVSNESEVLESFEWIRYNLGGIDILINNAGIYRQGLLSEMDTKMVQEVLNTNVMGIVYCTKEAFRSMKERQVEGHVVLINSITGHGIPQRNGNNSVNIYAPSKYAVTAMTEIYRQEFSNLGTKVKITSVSPGVVDTEIVPSEFRKGLKEDQMLRSEDISDAVLYCLATPPNVLIQELTIKPINSRF